MDVDTTHLDIEYPVPPGMGDLPVLPHSPCSDEFEEQAYNGVPEPCEGNEELKQEFEHGLITECECNAEAPTAAQVGFPYSLGPFLLFDTGMSDLSSDPLAEMGFKVSEAMDAWEAMFNGVEYNGRCSPFKDTTIPDLDAAYGLDSGTVDKIAWVYPDKAAYDEAYPDAHSNGLTETMTHRFLRTGGFVYLNAASETVALKEMSPATPTLVVPEGAQMTLTFGAPEGITADQANHACPGGFAPVTTQSIIDAGGISYCWDKSSTLAFCPHGCFTYNVQGVEGLAYLAFPVTDTTAHLQPEHYAATDQQAAAVASMITGVMAATNPPTEAEED
jgi:hypothetical protein